jgi:hypothetical protein
VGIITLTAFMPSYIVNECLKHHSPDDSERIRKTEREEIRAEKKAKALGN